MKWHQLNEDEQVAIETLNDLVAFVEENCKPYVQQNPNWLKKPLYRGIRNSGQAGARIMTIRQDRKPRDSSSLIQDQIDEYLKNNGYKALRSNSIFCTGDIGQAGEFGTVNVIFPIGDFNITWNEDITDLTVDMKQMMKIVPTDEPVINFEEMNRYTQEFLEAQYRKKRMLVPEVMSTNDLISVIGDEAKNEDLRHYLGKKSLLTLSDEFDSYYQNFVNDFIEDAIDSQNEILVTGNKYLAVNLHVYRDLKRNAK